MSFEQGFSRVPSEDRKDGHVEIEPAIKGHGAFDKFKQGLKNIVGLGVVGGALAGGTNEALANPNEAVSTNTPSAYIEISKIKVDSSSVMKIADHFKSEVEAVLALESQVADIRLFGKILQGARDLKNKLATFDLKTVSPKERGVWNKGIEGVQKLLITLGQTARTVGQDVWSGIEKQGLDGVKPDDRVKIAPIRDEANKWFEVQTVAEGFRTDLSRSVFSQHQVEEGMAGVK